MKNIKKLSLLLAILITAFLTFSFTSLAHDDIKEIENNDKIYTQIPWEYELSVFSDDLSYYDDEGNYLEFCVGENKFAPDGITSLNEGKLQKVFEHYYFYNGEATQTEEYCVYYEETEKSKINGYSCYYLQGKLFIIGSRRRM